MEPATPTALAGISKIIAGVLALSTPVETNSGGALPMQLNSQGDVLLITDPVGFELWESESGGSDVVAQLSPDDRVRFADFTERHMDEEIDFLVCGVVLMSPRIMERIDSGGFMISGPSGTDTLLDFMQNGCP